MRTLAPLLVLAAALAGCATPAGDDANADGHLVHGIQEGDAYGGNRFEPSSLSIRAGETVTWDVVGNGHHTADLLDPIGLTSALPTSGDLGPGETYSLTFHEPGTYRYHCKYHSDKQRGMVGTVHVA